MLVCAAIWLSRTYPELSRLPMRRRASVVSMGVSWILFGLGVLTIGLSEGAGRAGTLGVGLLILAVLVRILVWVALRMSG